MLAAIQLSQKPSDLARKCLLLPIPNNLFFLLSSPLLLASPKLFESILRIASDLSGFNPSHYYTGDTPHHFPLPNDL